jgi:putative methyltransferase (TIGR04325 family)
LIKRLFQAFFRKESASAFHGRFRDFSEAAAACRTPRGYEDEAFIDFIVGRVKKGGWKVSFPITDKMIFQAMGAFLVPALSRENREVLRVLDFGGGCGGYYRHFRTLLPPSLRLDWMVVENGSLVEAVRQRVDIRLLSPDNELSLVADLAEARERHFDLVLASGSLGYVRNPSRTFAALAGLDAPFMAVNRFPVFAGGKV